MSDGQPANAEPLHSEEEPAASGGRSGKTSRTRTGTAWVGICVGVLLAVLLVIFLLQNRQRVQVSFLWLSGTLPLAIALFVAGVGAALLTVVVGAARIAQLRRQSRKAG